MKAFFIRNWIREWELTVNPNDFYIRVIVVLQGYTKTR